MRTMRYWIIFFLLGMVVHAWSQEVQLFEQRDGATGNLLKRYYAYYIGDQQIYHGVYQQYANDGSGLLRAEMEYTDGKLNGFYRTYYIDGRLARDENYRDNTLHGRSQSWRLSGDRYFQTADEIYDNGVKDGCCISWSWSSGDVLLNKITAVWSKGVLNGFYENIAYNWDTGAPQTVITGNYLDGLQEGLFVTRVYYDDGLQSSEYAASYSSGFEINAKETTWTKWSSGAYGISAIYERLYGMKHGLCLDYDAQGLLSHVSHYAYNRFHGTVENFSNGKLFSKYIYRNGSSHGTQRTYNDAGVLSKYTYVNGQQHGPYEKYHSDGSGSLYIRGQYSNGSEYGIRTTWPSPGSLKPITRDYGAAIPLHPYESPTLNSTVSGVVVDRYVGAPIAAATVTVNGSVATTDSDGSFSVVVEAADTANISCSKAGAFPVSGTIALGNGAPKGVTLQMVQQKPKPQIKSVKNNYSSGSFFLGGLPAPAPLEFDVVWNSAGQTGTVSVVANQGNCAELLEVDGDTWRYRLDPASPPFWGTLNPAYNRMTIQAMLNGRVSDPVRYNYTVFPIPSWAQTLGSFRQNNDGTYGLVTYQLNARFPAQPFAFTISSETLSPTAWTAWSYIPFIGGKSFGLEYTQAGLEVEAKSDGSGSAALTGATGFSAGGQTIIGKIGGKGNVAMVQGSGLVFQGADLLLNLEGIISAEANIADLFPQLRAAAALPVVGQVIGRFNAITKAKAAVTAGVDNSLQVVSKDGTLKLAAASGAIKTGLNVGLEFQPHDKLKAELFGGGETILYWQIPADPGYLKDAESKVYAKMLLTVWNFEKAFQVENGFRLSDPAMFAEPASFSAMDSIADPEWRRVAPPINTNGYFYVQSPIQLLGIAGTSSVLIANIYRNAELTAAYGNGTSAVACVYFNPALPAERATDIFSLTLAAGSNTPLTSGVVTTNQQAEFAPAAVYDASNRLLLAWEQVRASASATTNIEETAAAMEIVYAMQNTSGSFAAPVAVTDNGYLDSTPRWVQSATGALWLCWQSQAENELLGSSGHPVLIHAVPWNAATGTFGPTITTLALTNMITWSVSAQGAQLDCICSIDTDGDELTQDDAEIAHYLWNGSIWSGATLRTENAMADHHPWNSSWSGGSAALWIQNGRLVYDDGVTITPVASESAIPVPETYRAAMEPQSGTVAVVWQISSETGTALYAAVRDPVYAVWSEPFVLYAGEKYARDAQLCFEGSADLSAVFAVNQVSTSDYSVVSSDLMRTRVPLGCNPAFGAIRLDPENPHPGMVVTARCEIVNSGPLAVSNLAITCTVGTKTNQTGSAVLLHSGLIPGFGASELEVVLTAPASADEPHWLHWSIDGSATLEELDETDNDALTDLFQPDLVAVVHCIERTPVSGSTQLKVKIENRGGSSSTAVDVAMSIDGSGFGRRTLPAIAGGSFFEMYFDVVPGIDFTNATAKIEIALDVGGVLAETSELNNLYRLTYGGVEDMDRDGLDDGWELYYHMSLQYGSADDADGDGRSEQVEFATGTNPSVADAPLRVSVSRNPDASRALEWNSLDGAVYDIYCSTNLTCNWNYRGTLRGDGSLQQFRAPLREETESRSLFYRVLLRTDSP